MSAKQPLPSNQSGSLSLFSASMFMLMEVTSFPSRWRLCTSVSVSIRCSICSVRDFMWFTSNSSSSRVSNNSCSGKENIEVIESYLVKRPYWKQRFRCQWIAVTNWSLKSYFHERRTSLSALVQLEERKALAHPLSRPTNVGYFMPQINNQRFVNF